MRYPCTDSIEKMATISTAAIAHCSITPQSPPAQVPEPCVWHAPEGDCQTAEFGREGRPRCGDPDCWLQGLQGRHRAGGILAAWGRDGKSDGLLAQAALNNES